jgi:uncharacterized protein (DUF2236 family)
MRPFGDQRPSDTAGAVALLAQAPNGAFLAGGTNLVDLMRLGVATPDVLDTGRSARPWPLPDRLPPGTPGDPGWFGPGSQVWRVWRERLLLLGGPAAVLLQLAHPLIAAGVATHSNFRDNPLRRLRATLDTTLTVVFGDRQQARTAAARVGKLHQRVQGRLPVTAGCFPAGTVYRASDPQLALWVHATLVMVALDVMDQFVGSLSLGQRADFYQQSKHFARLFGVTEQVLPDSYVAFQAYLQSMLQGPELAVDQTSQGLAAAVLDGWRLGLSRPPVAATKLLTAGLLPARFQEGFGLAWGRREQHRYVVLRSVLRTVAPSLPPTLRFWPHYRVALRRAAAIPRPADAA